MQQITLVYNRSNTYGIRRDAELLDALIAKYTRSVKGNSGFTKVRHADLLEPPQKTDVCIHLEIPSSGWAPFARSNILMINPEWWVPAWNPLLSRFDAVLCKQKQLDISGVAFTSVPWSTAVNSATRAEPHRTDKAAGCLWLLGGSRNKRAFAQVVLPLWKEEYPSIAVYSTEPLFPADATPSLASNVVLHCQELDDHERWRLQQYYPIHMCASRAEGFGHAAAEGERAGAFLILNTIPAYTDNFPASSGVAYLTTPTQSDAKYPYSQFADLSGCTLQAQLDTLLREIPNDLTAIQEIQVAASERRSAAFQESMFTILQQMWNRSAPAALTAAWKHLPPILDETDCPSISIITPTYNRRKLIEIAFHNLILSDYPKDKIEWVVVDDSDAPDLSISDKIATFAKRAPVANVMYIPLPRKSSIGYKRNVGIERSSHDIILFMDDDDHYPATSFRRRVAWLTRHPWKASAVGCTTIACYDLLHGVSAVNTPPWELSTAERVSEATLTFYKSFWAQGKFSHTNIAEGERFLHGRETEFLEIPPQQILVAFRHQGNVSSRCIPPAAAAAGAGKGCFWGFPKEYIVWIHSLVGVKVEEENNTVAGSGANAAKKGKKR